LAPARKITKKPKRGPKRVIRPPKAAPRVDPPPQAKPATADYSVPLTEAICEQLASGLTGAEVCRMPDMPAWAVLCRWRRKHADFDRRYRIAREQGCEHFADEIITIADDGSNDYVARLSAKGKRTVVFDRDHYERSRLRVDARKWTVSKILRHVYGDKAEVDLRTPDGLNVTDVARNTLIEQIVKLVQPKADGRTKPEGKQDEPRER